MNKLNIPCQKKGHTLEVNGVGLQAGRRRLRLQQLLRWQKPRRWGGWCFSQVAFLFFWNLGPRSMLGSSSKYRGDFVTFVWCGMIQWFVMSLSREEMSWNSWGLIQILLCSRNHAWLLQELTFWMMRYNAHCQAHIDSEIIYCCVFGMKLRKWTVCFPNRKLQNICTFMAEFSSAMADYWRLAAFLSGGPLIPPASRSKWLKHQQKVQHQVSIKGMMCQWWCHFNFKFRYENLFWFEGKLTL